MRSRLDYSAINWKGLVYYDETSPTFLRWKINIFNGESLKRQQVKIGDVAGGCERKGWHGYSTLSYNYKRYRIQNIVWVLHNNKIEDDLFIDHIDGDRLNNRIDNLRQVTRAVNNRNHGKQSNNKTGVTGVSLRELRGKLYFVARWIELEGKQRSKAFSVEKYGSVSAFEMACEKRKYEIMRLNKQGAGYSDRHGV